LELPPPGEGLFTVIASVCADAKKFAGIVAVRVVEFTKEVVTFTLFTTTVEDEMKFVPVTVTARLLNPPRIELGFNCVIVGIGFPTVKVSRFDWIVVQVLVPKD
jgi:hypothetical protein